MRQRRDSRVCGALKVFETGDEDEPSVTRNISTSGMFLVTKKPWSEGDVVSLDIRHRYCEHTLEARVVHRRPDGAGLKFVDPDDEQKKKLAFVIDALLADGAWLDDRRAKLRTEVSGPVVWRVGKMEVQSRLRDLSSGGAFIETTESPEIGTQVLVYLPAVDDGTEVRGCQATVLHRSAEGFGIEFVFPSDEFIEAVAEVTGEK